MIIHPRKGKLTKKGRKYHPIGNRVDDVYVDETGNEHTLDGTEKTDGMINDEAKMEQIKSDSAEEKEFEKLAEQMHESEKEGRDGTLVKESQKTNELLQEIIELLKPNA